MMFASTTAFEVCRASSSPTGYFRGARNLSLLVVEDEGRKWAVHLQAGEGQFEYNEITPHWQESGIAFIEPAIEVDIDTCFDPEYGAQPGDLLVSPNGLHVVAVSNRGGIRGLQMTFALWGQVGSQGPVEHHRFSVGFKAWKLVGPSEVESTTLWERLAPPA